MILPDIKIDATHPEIFVPKMPCVKLQNWAPRWRYHRFYAEAHQDWKQIRALAAYIRVMVILNR